MAERTKYWIADKMKSLMKKKSIDKIRITEICQAAKIERSTFYYHFKDKYELVAWIFFQDADRTTIIDLHDAAEGMKQMKNDMLFCKRAYEDTSQNALWQYRRMLSTMNNHYSSALGWSNRLSDAWYTYNLGSCTNRKANSEEKCCRGRFGMI